MSERSRGKWNRCVAPGRSRVSGLQGNRAARRKKAGESGFTIAVIDHERWLVIGLDIGSGESSRELRVMAWDLIPEGKTNVFEYVTEKHGHIPVTEIWLHDVDPYEVLKASPTVLSCG